MIDVFLIIAVLAVSTFLFYKAAGTLNPGKLNIVSYMYYIFLLQSFLGTALIALGFDKHYTLKYLLERESSISITIIMVWLTAVLFPAMIVVWEKIFKVSMKDGFQCFLKSELTVPEKNGVFTKLFLTATLFCALFFAGYLMKIGYIPIFRLIHAPEGFDFATERVRISGIYFLNSYINNILLFTIIPLMSYISFAYVLATKSKVWVGMSGVMFVMSCVCKTYKFEKTPIVFHLLIFVLIFLLFKGGIKWIHMVIIGGALACVVVFAYIATGFSGSMLDIYNGPLGRTLFTQVGTLSYHFDLFPAIFGFLGGRSFSPTLLRIVGMDTALHLRSAKIVMAFYGSDKVYDGTAGVMNTLFIGEAYANWGFAGVFIAIVWVALVVSFLLWLIFKMKKTPTSLCMMAILTVRLGTMMQGGFCDFVYSFDILFTCAALLGVYYIFENEKDILKTVKGKIQTCLKK